MFRSDRVRADALYERQTAVVVGESNFAFMSEHDRLLQLQSFDGADFGWYVKESEIIMPRLLDHDAGEAC
jgi:hypothetical protein